MTSEMDGRRTASAGEPETLRDELVAVMKAGADVPLPEARFNELALRVFRFQCAANPVYGAFVRGRGVEVADLSDWREIPPVPTRAFKELTLVSGDPEIAPLRFRTSGTTRGRERRGEHRVLAPELYRASVLAGARAYLHPDSIGGPPDVAAPGSGAASPGSRTDERSLRVLALSPDPSERPDSSLAYMLGVLVEEWDDGGGGFLADPDCELSAVKVDEALESAANDGAPTLVAGTAFAFVHLLDRMADSGAAIALPADSVIMETGGFKGRSREVERGELYARIAGAFGVPVARIVNEYGMTELLSQYWEPVLREGGPALPDERRHLPPPWMRPRILHPESLAPVPAGDVGILCHFDLANLFSVAAVLTEDLGVAVGEGIRVLGRAPGAEPRGCSITMEELLGVAPGGRGP